jgi:long-chain acyl-CoA synthetase
MNAEPAANLASMFRAQATRLGPCTALRFKRHGLYGDLSWEAYLRLVDRAACGWISLGINVGDRIALLSENRFEWLVADLSFLAAGAADVSMHAPLTAAQVAYQLNDSGARWVVVSNTEQLAKVAEVQPQLPQLEGIVAFDCPEPAGLPIKFATWAGLLQRGAAAAPRFADALRERERSLGRDDLAALIYTSGTTGEPKGVMLTHGNLIENAAATYQALPPGPADVLLSWLPYSHIYARLCDHYLSIYSGCTVAVAEGIDSLIRNLLEVQPTHMSGVPRFYEKVWDDAAARPESERAKKLRDTFGPRLRWMSAGGAPLPPHVAEGFNGCGIPLLQGYGLTESSPVISFNTLDAHRIGTVGRPIPGVEVRIAADGEVLTRGPHVMRGYWNKPQATAEALDADGWLHTGDLGELDADGFLTITGRKKDLIVLSSGKKVAPQQIESLLATDEFIDQAVVYGDRKKFLSAVIVPNLSALAAEARRRGIAVGSAQELASHSAIHDFMEGRVAERLSCVSASERVKRFILLDRAFTLAADELTATLKVRRQIVIDRYRRELDALYDSD